MSGSYSPHATITIRVNADEDEFTYAELVEIGDALERLAVFRKATGGLTPELVAKALDAIGDWFSNGGMMNPKVEATFTDADVDALLAATFEVPA